MSLLTIKKERVTNFKQYNCVLAINMYDKNKIDFIETEKNLLIIRTPSCSIGYESNKEIKDRLLDVTKEIMNKEVDTEITFIHADNDAKLFTGVIVKSKNNFQIIM